MDPDSTTSITVSWMVISSITPTSYIISYSNIDNTQCFTISSTTTIAGSLSSYTIEGLQEATQYSITVSIVDRSDQDTAEATTMAAGMSNNEKTFYSISNKFIKYLFPPAPSAPPTLVDLSDVTSSSITVQWGPVDCTHHNGDITGYSVQYGVQGSGSTQTMSVTGGATTETTITGLTPSTTYSVKVAAVNTINTGEYSDLLSVITEGKSIFKSLKPLLSIHHPCSCSSSGYEC